MRSLRIVLSLLWALSSVVLAESRFVVSGNADLPTGAILREIRDMDCPGSDSVCVQSVCDAVAEHYWGEGYLDARIRCRRSDASSETVEILIDEGSVSLLRAVKISGGLGDAKVDVDAIFGEQIGMPFSQSGLEQGISRLLELCDGSGYPLAKIEPELISVADGYVDVGLKVTPGPKTHVGRVIFRGAKRTRHDVLMRETGLEVGEQYDGIKVEDAKARLSDLSIFEAVSEPILGLDHMDTTVSVTFEVVEAKTSVFEGLAAYSPSSQDRFVGSLDLDLRNLAGTLRRSRINWRKAPGGRLNWSLYYREPRILGKPFAVEGRLSSDVVDTIYARRKFWAGLTFVGEPRWEFGLGGLWGSTKDRSLSGGEGNFSESGLSFDFRYEGRGDALNPRSGQFFRLSHEVTSLEFEEEASADRTLTWLEAELEHLAGLSNVMVLALRSRFEGVFSSSESVPPSHLIRPGGMRTLRGYPEEWFLAERILVMTLEARRLLGRYSRIYAFFDSATMEADGHKFGKLRGLPFGYGIGFIGGSRSGILRLEIAMGRGDDWSEAKLHLGLIQRF